MAGVPNHWEFQEVFDTLERGCGDFLLELRTLIAPLEPGTLVMVVSRDAGAPVEVPAWCRMTGHVLCESHPPFYLLQKRVQ